MIDEYISTRLSEIEKERLDLINKAAFNKLVDNTKLTQIQFSIEGSEIIRCVDVRGKEWKLMFNIGGETEIFNIDVREILRRSYKEDPMCSPFHSETFRKSLLSAALKILTERLLERNHEKIFGDINGLAYEILNEKR